ncbi:MAG: hypothetical protein ACXAAT_13510, partial [Candidatus Hodarchaeales archaeon]
MKNLKLILPVIVLFVMITTTSSQVSACTIFTATIGDTVFFAGNEDGYSGKIAGIKIEPAGINYSGEIHLGFIRTNDDGEEYFSYQIGMNEH